MGRRVPQTSLPHLPEIKFLQHGAAGLSNAGSLSLLRRSHCAKLVGGYSRSPRFMSKPFPGEFPSYLSARRGICYGLNAAYSRLIEI